MKNYAFETSSSTVKATGRSIGPSPGDRIHLTLRGCCQGFWLAAIGLLLAPAAFAQDSVVGEQPLWPEGVLNVDRTRQTYERVRPRPRPTSDDTKFPLRFSGKAGFSVQNSTSFKAGSTYYRLGHVLPVEPARICTYVDGARWACGFRSKAALNGLMAGGNVRCRPLGIADAVTVVECQRKGRDLGHELVAAGFALSAPDDGRYDDAERDARKRQSGIWAASPERFP